MRRFLRRLTVTLGVLAILLLIAAVVLWHTVAPGYVAQQIGAALTRAGITPHSFRLRQLSLGQVILTDVKLGPGDALRAEAIIATYRLADLRKGRLRRLEIIGLRYDAASGWAPPPSAGASSGPLPFDELTLSAQVDVPVRGRTITLPFHGGATPQPDGSLALQLHTRLLSEPVTITGHVLKPGFDLTAAASLGTLRVRQDATGSPYLLSLQAPAQSRSWKLPAGDLIAQAASLEADLEIDAATHQPTRGRFAGQAQQLALGKLSLRGPSLQAELSPGGAGWSVDAGVSELTLPRASGRDLKVQWNQGGGSVSFAGVQAADQWLEGATWQIAPSDAGWLMHGPWTPLADWPLTVNLALSTPPRGWGAVLAVNATDVPITEKTALLADTLAPLATEVSGKVSFEARISWQGGAPQQQVTVALRDGSLSRAEGSQQVSGLEADLKLDSLAPLGTIGPQKVTWKQAKLGDIALRDGRLQFSVEGPRSILVERAHVWIGQRGQLWAHAFRFDPEDLDVETEIFWEHVALEDWLSVATLDHVAGTGLVSGRLPLQVRTQPDLKITFGEGFLTAESGGTLKLLDRTAAERVARDVTLGNLSEEVQDRVLVALEDFAYDTLRFDLQQRDQGLLLRVTTRGRGRRPPMQEIGGLTINVNNADEVLDLFLRIKLGLASATERLVAPRTPQRGDTK